MTEEKKNIGKFNDHGKIMIIREMENLEEFILLLFPCVNNERVVKCKGHTYTKNKRHME